MSHNTRRIEPVVIYNGVNISSDLRPFLKGLSVTDNMAGQADDLQITLEDKAGLWQSAWFPEKGATLSVSLICNNWEKISGAYKLGTFEIDEITSSGPPSEVQIKAVSVPDNNRLRGTERTRSWEKAELKRIANDIAKDAGLELVYDTTYNPVVDRAEQSQESDLYFLQHILRDHGLALKIYENQIVIFDEANYEQAIPNNTLLKPGNAEQNIHVKSYSLKSQLRDIYKACHVKYQNGKEHELIEATFIAPDKTNGKTLEINEQVKNLAEAERLAKKRLREKNCEEITGNFSLLGNPLLMASSTIMLIGFGQYDGKYIITRAAHSIGSGYTTDIDIRRCLNGY